MINPLDWRYALATALASLWLLPTSLFMVVRSAVVTLEVTLLSSVFESGARVRMSLRFDATADTGRTDQRTGEKKVLIGAARLRLDPFERRPEVFVVESIID